MQPNQQNQLRPYQIEGVEKLIGLAGRRGGAILADEPGLGKTAQTAEFINPGFSPSQLAQGACPLDETKPGQDGKDLLLRGNGMPQKVKVLFIKSKVNY